MKVAITSTGETLDSKIDQRFGRCAYFVIYDTDTGEAEIVPNPNKDATGGAGPATVQMVTSHNVQKIISGEFGVKVKSLFESLKIEMIVIKEPEKTVRDIINIIKQKI